LSKPVYDAGSVYRGGAKNLIEHTFIIKNKGSVETEIFKAQPGEGAQ